MSGGVDSSVAALLLKEQGMEVIGISMKTHDSSPQDHVEGQGCCSADDINDARRICQQLDIPFYPLNFTEEFQEKVIENFASEYAQGRTPNPCVHCNDQIKFASLLKESRKLGAYYLATGHYAQRSRDRYGKYHILRAKDHAKDQTYFLFGLGQEQLEHVLFPIGKYTKDEVREFAKQAGLKTADKPESQEICFVTGDDYRSFIENELPQYRGVPGNFVDIQGKSLGEHDGVHAYTVGQRRGLGVTSSDRLYVTEIKPEANQVVLGAKEGLLKSGLIAKGVRWVNREQATSGLEVEVKLRYRHPGVTSILRIEDDATIRIEFQNTEGAVTPGQAVVFYHGEELLGGGWIEKGIA